MKEITTIELPKKIIEDVVSILYGTEDRGPSGEGWKSKDLIELIHVLEESIGIPKDKQY